MTGKAHLEGISTWATKKQNSISLSNAKAEYITVGSFCTQLFWMKHMLNDYSIEQDSLTMFCDNTGATNISKNHVHHSRTKHNNIQLHFIKDLVERKIVVLEHKPTKTTTN